MAFINVVLDEAVAYGFEGGGSYNTNEVRLENGIRHPDSAWEYPLHRYSAQLDNLPDQSRDNVINLFHVMRGKRHNFKFKDWNDYTGEDQPLNVPAEYVGTTDPVQLYKTYVAGPAYTIRPIWAFESAVISNGGVPVAGSLDTETGMFYPAAPWVASDDYTWTGEFYVWVHFKDDYNSFTINSWRANTADIDLEEDPLEITATNVPLSWEE